MPSVTTEGPDSRFAALDPVLSPPARPDATVRALRRHGDQIILSGQVAFAGTELIATGVVGDDVDMETAIACARQCAINLLGRLQEELGTLEAVEAVLKITVFVASAPGFRDQPQVAGGASRVFHEVLGEPGRHARSAVGVAELPLGTPVEVEAVVAVRGERN